MASSQLQHPSARSPSRWPRTQLPATRSASMALLSPVTLVSSAMHALVRPSTWLGCSVTSGLHKAVNVQPRAQWQCHTCSAGCCVQCAAAGAAVGSTACCVISHRHTAQHCYHKEWVWLDGAADSPHSIRLLTAIGLSGALGFGLAVCNCVCVCACLHCSCDISAISGTPHPHSCHPYTHPCCRDEGSSRAFFVPSQMVCPLDSEERGLRSERHMHHARTQQTCMLAVVSGCVRQANHTAMVLPSLCPSAGELVPSGCLTPPPRLQQIL